MENEDYLNESFLNEDNWHDEEEEEEEEDKEKNKNIENKNKTTDDEILQSLWKKTDKETAAKLKRKSTVPLLKFTEQELTSKKGLFALKEMFDNYEVNKKLNPYENMNQILAKMEYWAHQLFPQYNFEDFLTKTELLGHKHSVQKTLQQLRLNLLSNNDDLLIDNTADNENKTKKLKTAEELFDEGFGNDIVYKDLFANIEDVSNKNFNKENNLNNNLLNSDKNLTKTKEITNNEYVNFLSTSLNDSYEEMTEETLIINNKTENNQSEKNTTIDDVNNLLETKKDDSNSDIELTPIKKRTKKIVFSDDETED